MTEGAKVIDRAIRREGLVEVPINSGYVIEGWQKMAAADQGYPIHTYDGAPWCAIFIAAMYREAGVPIDRMLVHPFTGYICKRADELGGLKPKGLVPPGSLFIFCSIHVGLVVRDRGNGLLDTIEGNASDMVRFALRDKRSGRVIVPPTIEQTATGAMMMRPSYGFDDLNIKPLTFGPWENKGARTRKMNEYIKNHPGRWVVPVEMERNDEVRYAFRSGEGGTYGAKWKLGGWPSKEGRDFQKEQYAKRVGHENLRDWRRNVPVPAGNADRDSITNNIKTT